AVHVVGAAPHVAEKILGPVALAGFFIQAVEDAALFADEDQAVVNGARAHGAAEIDGATALGSRHDRAAEGPDQGRFLVLWVLGVDALGGHIAFAANIDAHHVAVLGFETAVRAGSEADKRLAVLHDGRGNDVVLAVFLGFGVALAL